MDSLQKVCRNVKYLFDAIIIDPVQIKVRELTTADPWGPAASDMSELAKLTYSKAPIIVTYLFRRVNEDNWRIVYKALVVLDYIIKHGSDTVSPCCNRNLSRFLELQNCRTVEGCPDQGLNIREKARQIVNLLTNPSRLKLERSNDREFDDRITYGQTHLRDTFRDYAPTQRDARDRGVENEIEELVPPATVAEDVHQLNLALFVSQQEENGRKMRRKSPPVYNQQVGPDLALVSNRAPSTVGELPVTYDLIDFCEANFAGTNQTPVPGRVKIWEFY